MEARREPSQVGTSQVKVARASGHLAGLLGYALYQPNPLQQIFYLLLVVGGYSAFLFSGLPHLPNDSLSEIHVYLSLVTVLGALHSFIVASMSSPGVLLPQTLVYFDNYDFDNVLYRKRECLTCKTSKLARSKHCSICNKCVPRFDHHERAVVQLRLLLGEQFLNESTHTVVQGEPMVVVRYLVHAEAAVTVLFVLCVGMGFALVCFSGFHLYLVSSNLTTNEFFKRKELRRSSTATNSLEVRELRITGASTKAISSEMETPTFLTPDDLYEQARRFDVDLCREPYLVPLMKLAATIPNPPKRQHEDDGSEAAKPTSTYYYNFVTKAQQNIHPLVPLLGNNEGTGAGDTDPMTRAADPQEFDHAATLHKLTSMKKYVDVHERRLRPVMEQLQKELAKYELRSHGRSAAAPATGRILCADPHRSRCGVSLRQLLDEIAMLQVKLATYRPDLARRLFKMTITTRSKRVSAFGTGTPTPATVAPGSYATEQAITSFGARAQRPLFSSFATSGKRNLNENKTTSAITPGLISRFAPSAPGSTIFGASSVQDNPGPGSYLRPASSPPSNNQREHQGPHKFAHLVKPSVPAIPQRQQSYGYVQVGVELQRQSPPGEIYSGIGQDTVGPAAYSRHNPIWNEKKNAASSLNSTAKREVWEENKQLAKFPGPVFASKVPIIPAPKPVGVYDPDREQELLAKEGRAERYRQEQNKFSATRRIPLRQAQASTVALAEILRRSSSEGKRVERRFLTTVPMESGFRARQSALA
uniref:Palmitoyltransferase n=1 Tax=Phytophthora ramorum TaxID=164328 RepID=H3HD04_PHYRM